MSHLSGPKMVSFTVEGMYCLHGSISCDSTEKGYRTPLHTHTYTHPVWQVWDPQSCTWCHCTHEAIDSCTLHHKWWSHNVTVCTETQVHDALHMIRTGSDIAVHINTSKYSLSKVLLGTCTAVNEHKQFPLFYIALSRVCCANTTNTFDMCMCITVDWFEQCNVPEVDILSLSVTQRLRS